MKAGIAGKCGVLLGCLNDHKCPEPSGVAIKIRLPKINFGKLVDYKTQKATGFDLGFAVTFLCGFFIVINLLPGGMCSHKSRRTIWL